MKISRERWKISRDYPEPGRRELFNLRLSRMVSRIIMEIIFQHGLYFISPVLPSSPDFSTIYILIHLSFHFIVFARREDNNNDDDDDDIVFFFFLEKFNICNFHSTSFVMINKKKKFVAWDVA